MIAYTTTPSIEQRFFARDSTCQQLEETWSDKAARTAERKSHARIWTPAGREVIEWDGGGRWEQSDDGYNRRSSKT